MKKVNIDINKFYSAPEVAEILGVSRTVVFKRIKKKIIKAAKVGRNYVIIGSDLKEYVSPSRELTDAKKEVIEDIVKKVIKEYGEALKKLGKT